MRRTFSGILLMAAAMTMRLSSAGSIPSVGPLDVIVDFQPDSTGAESTIWFAYILSRADFVNHHEKLYEQVPGPIAPSFTEEVGARLAAVKVYRGMRLRNTEFHVAYFDDLELVEAQSFIREYVWTFLRQPRWTAAPADLRLAAFDAWRETRLPHHVAESKGELRFSEAQLRLKTFPDSGSR